MSEAAAPVPATPTPTPPSAVQRVRIRYAKTEPLRYTGNLDLQRVWERALRRSRLPVAYSQGFHPQVRMHLASALPLGLTSRCELLDLWLESALPTQEIENILRQAVPPGIEILTLDEVPFKDPALQTQITAAEYEAILLEPIDTDELAERVRDLLNAETLPRERRGKTYDLRPLVEALEIRASTSAKRPLVWMRLSAREAATGRADEVLEVLGFSLTAARVVRTALII